MTIIPGISSIQWMCRLTFALGPFFELTLLNRDVPGTTDVTDETTGYNRRHPKVYVGFFSHASFPEINRRYVSSPS